MPPRASWKGNLRLSLVTLPVRLYNAISSTARISLNQLHRETHRRLRQQMIEPELGPVDREDIVKGYEYEKGKYVVVDDSDLEQIRLETTKTIELTRFVDADEVDPLYFDSPYFVAPDGPVGQEAFRVLREAMRRENKIGIGRVVMSNREQIIAIAPHDRGMKLTTLHYASEVRSADNYFDDIEDGDVNEQHLKLAEQLIESSSGPFEPGEFNDRYQDALLEVIKAKLEGAEPVIPQEAETGRIINLMDALKQSVAASGNGKSASAEAGDDESGKKKSARARKKPAAKSVKSTKKTAAKRKRA